MIIKHSNGDINQSVRHKPTHDPNNGQFQNLHQSSLLRLPTASYKGHVFTHIVGWASEHLKASAQDDQPVLEPGKRSWSDNWSMDGTSLLPIYPVCWGQWSYALLSLFSDSHGFRWWMALYRQGPPYGEWPSGLLPRCSSFLGLRVCSAEQWSSVEALFKSVTPGHLSEYALLHGTSSLEMGVVLHPHMPGLHWDRKFSLFMMACFFLTLVYGLRLLYYF